MWPFRLSPTSVCWTEGLSVAVIAAELGLTAEEVLTDARIAAEISHPNGLAPQTQSDEC